MSARVDAVASRVQGALTTRKVILLFLIVFLYLLLTILTNSFIFIIYQSELFVRWLLFVCNNNNMYIYFATKNTSIKLLLIISSSDF